MSDSQAVIILGTRLVSGSVHPELQGKLDTGISVFRKMGAEYLIMSGGFTNPDVAKSEAEVMKSYALEKGIDESSIILDEEAQDTIGNGYFTRIIVDALPGVRKMCVVSSCYHMPRAQYIFNFCFANNYEMDFNNCCKFVPAVNNEPRLMEATIRFFEGIPPGDLGSIGQKLLSDPRYKK